MWHRGRKAYCCCYYCWKRFCLLLLTLAWVYLGFDGDLLQTISTSENQWSVFMSPTVSQQNIKSLSLFHPTKDSLFWSSKYCWNWFAFNEKVLLQKQQTCYGLQSWTALKFWLPFLHPTSLTTVKAVARESVSYPSSAIQYPTRAVG